MMSGLTIAGAPEWSNGILLDPLGSPDMFATGIVDELAFTEAEMWRVDGGEICSTL